MEFAVFGRALERCRIHFLPDLHGIRRALVLGDGDGRFLKRLLDAAPGLRADYVDRSAGMLALAKLRASQATFHCADVLTDALPQADFDLVAAHFFFDCFDREELVRVIARVRAAAPGARWLVSEFRVPEGCWARPAGWWIAVMYRFFAATTGLRTRRLEDHRPLQPVACATRARGLLVSELWAARST
jgi:SAM-dependent methyltransferase